MTQVAILVPGIMGSELYLKDELVWPGSVFELVVSYKKMAQLLDPSLVAKDLIRSVSISNQYQQLIDDLALCDFREHIDPPTLYMCPYDWRKDNAHSARALADVVDEVVAAHGTTVEISLLGHSMGGLVSRYYLESGDFSSRPGYKAVRRLLTLGTPHRGAPLALCAALGMEKRLFLSADQVKELASRPEYPSLYQLLPPPGEPFAWDEDKTAAYAAVDIYDGPTAKVLGLVSENIESARGFHAKLDLAKRPEYKGQPIRYFFFAGTRQRTVASVTLRRLNTTQFRVRRAELDDAGDGTVPIWSGSFTGIQGQAVGGEHGTIYRNDVLRRTMAVLLGKQGVLAAVPEHVEVAIRERVAYPNDLVHVALTFSTGPDKLNGTLSVERILFDANGNVTGYAKPVSNHPIVYTGLNAEQLNITLPVPAIAAICRVAYYPTGSSEPAGSDELFVQAP
jgi:pimeloyl-ACP methyl ester carboxylesterase